MRYKAARRGAPATSAWRRGAVASAVLLLLLLLLPISTTRSSPCGSVSCSSSVQAPKQAPQLQVDEQGDLNGEEFAEGGEDGGHNTDPEELEKLLEATEPAEQAGSVEDEASEEGEASAGPVGAAPLATQASSSSILSSFEPRGTVSVLKSRSKVVYVHISKAAGTSFYSDAKRRFGARFTSSVHTSEHCAPSLASSPSARQSGAASRLAIMFRRPRDHVLSQYLECKWDQWGVRQTKGTKFPRGDLGSEDERTGRLPLFEQWLEHFEAETPGPMHNSFNCYDPHDMQTRFLHCHNTRPRSPQEWDYEHENRFDAHATANKIRGLWYVGITEHYIASLCLFGLQYTGKLADWCGCGRTPPNSAHITHNVPPHDAKRLSARAVEMIDGLTRQDVVTYEMALSEFKARITTVQRNFAVQLVCDSDW